MSQPFERYPALASWVERLANTKIGLSLGDWMVFVGCLNNTIVQAEARRAEPVHPPAQEATGAVTREELSDVVMHFRARSGTTQYESGHALQPSDCIRLTDAILSRLGGAIQRTEEGQ